MTELMQRLPSAPSGGEDASQFFREIRSFPRLTAQEEQQLARRCAEGDEEAIRQMVNTNMGLVVSVARSYAGRGASFLDLVQEGSIGLLTAARKFDHTMDCRFSTYATKWIRQGISRYLMTNSGLIRVPEHTAERMQKIQAARGKLQQETGESPSAEAIAELTGISAEKVEQLMLLDPEICSLDIPVGNEEGGTLGALIQDDRNTEPLEELVRRELEQTIDLLLGTLETRQRQILRLHFGMEDGICHSLEEIGRDLGISKERVRQIERQAMDKLRKMGVSMGLEDFLE